MQLNSVRFQTPQQRQNKPAFGAYKIRKEDLCPEIWKELRSKGLDSTKGDLACIGSGEERTIQATRGGNQIITKVLKSLGIKHTEVPDIK